MTAGAQSAEPARRPHTRAHPCPICDGHDALPRGHGQRCHGYQLKWPDGRAGHYCGRIESAKRHPTDGELYWHPDAEAQAGISARSERPRTTDEPRRIALAYDYDDAEGNLAFQVVRFEPKDFRQRRPDGRGGWIWKMTGVELVLYELPDVLRARDAGDTIWICEGEKDADRVNAAGHVATCNPGGAGKWRPEYAETLKGAALIRVIADNDARGYAHARDVAHSLRETAIPVEVLRSPVGKDVSDLLDAGGTLDLLEPLALKPNGETAEGVPHAESYDVSRDRLRYLSEFQPERVSWLWEGRIPLGKTTAADGDPDLGKSTVLVDLAARLSTGRPLPDGSLGPGEPVSSIFLAAEDGIADTILPRLLAAGGDPRRVAVLEAVAGPTGGLRPPSLADDLTRIEEHIQRAGAKLLVIDPLFAFLAGSESKSPQEMAEVFGGLKAMLERTGCAGVALRHLAKSGGGKALYRGLMTVQIIASARSALYFERDPEDPGRYVLAVSKGNLAPPESRQSLAYRIEGADVADPAGGAPIRVGRIEWLGPVDLSADDLARASEKRSPAPRTEKAIEAIREILLRGPVEAEHAKEQLNAMRVSANAIKNAKTELGIRSIKSQFSGRWTWATPEQARQTKGRD